MRDGGVEIKRMRLRFPGRGLFKRWMREREKEEGVGRMIQMVQIWRAEQTSYGWH